MLKYLLLIFQNETFIDKRKFNTEVQLPCKKRGKKGLNEKIVLLENLELTRNGISTEPVLRQDAPAPLKEDSDAFIKCVEQLITELDTMYEAPAGKASTK